MNADLWWDPIGERKEAQRTYWHAFKLAVGRHNTQQKVMSGQWQQVGSIKQHTFRYIWRPIYLTMMSDRSQSMFEHKPYLRYNYNVESSQNCKIESNDRFRLEPTKRLHQRWKHDVEPAYSAEHWKYKAIVPNNDPSDRFQNPFHHLSSK